MRDGSFLSKTGRVLAFTAQYTFDPVTGQVEVGIAAPGVSKRIGRPKRGARPAGVRELVRCRRSGRAGIEARDSAIVDGYGAMRASVVTPEGSEAVLVADVGARPALLLAARWADWVGWLCVAALVVAGSGGCAVARCLKSPPKQPAARTSERTVACPACRAAPVTPRFARCGCCWECIRRPLCFRSSNGPLFPLWIFEKSMAVWFDV